ncbi:hypothetical protein J5N97_014531 [Dioscorea zingiberensis]|uniref:Uncharacterized protein n=1 Tax=Dioscorea zingiberensis TaxID=325984 RepID=A0A9D5CU44_9LILI|nr:hypothetical protein J5N97_014531 [Dioscorea zingiberensis]
MAYGASGVKIEQPVPLGKLPCGDGEIEGSDMRRNLSAKEDRDVFSWIACSRVLSGIDYMAARFGDEDDPVAVAVVSAGGYENDDEDHGCFDLHWPGRLGKNDKNKLMTRNLKRGNLALERSLHRGNEIRDGDGALSSWDPIRAGAFICEYTGEVIDKGREDEDGENEYIFQPTNTDDNAFSWNYIPELLGEPSHPDSSDTIKPLQIIISAKNMGNISRFMNHSCSPNVFWQAVQRDNGDEGYPHIVFFAIRHIPPMTELTYDYGPCGDEIVRRACQTVIGLEGQRSACANHQNAVVFLS